MIFFDERRSQDRDNCKLCMNREMLGGRNKYGDPRLTSHANWLYHIHLARDMEDTA